MSNITLNEIALQKVIENYSENRYQNASFVVFPEFCDKIFKQFREKTSFHSQAHATSMSQQLKTTVLRVKSDDFNEKDEAFLKHQEGLQSLEFLKMDRIDQWDADEAGEDALPVFQILSTAINLLSRSSLVSLKIYETRPSEWDRLHELHRLFPNLAHLTLPPRSLNGKRFSLVCQNFKNLTSLDISGCDLTTLTGIANLPKLKMLKMSGEQIKHKNELKELCRLENLIVLDFTRSKLEQNLGMEDPEPLVVCYLAQCLRDLFANKIDALPKLEILNVTRHYLEYADMVTFYGRLKSIKSMGLVSTSLNTLDMVLPKLEIYNCATLKSSLAALKFYLKIKDMESVNEVLEWIVNNHLEVVEQEMVEDVEWRKKWMRFMCDVINDFEESFLNKFHLNCSKILKTLCNTPTIKSFTDDDLTYIMKCYWKRHEQYIPTARGKKSMAEFWQIFAHPDFLSNFRCLGRSTETFFFTALCLSYSHSTSDFAPHMLRMLKNLFESAEYANIIFGYPQVAQFYMNLHLNIPPLRGETPEIYILKLEATLAAVKRSASFREEFLENDGFEKYNERLQVLNNEESIKIAQLKVRRAIVRNLEDWSTWFDEQTMTDAVNDFCAAMFRNRFNMTYNEYITFTISRCITVAFDMDIEILEEIRGDIQLDRDAMLDVRKDPEEMEFYRWAKSDSRTPMPSNIRQWP